MNAQVTEQTEQLRTMLSNLSSDEQSMQQRIDKKKSELDRHEKRFASLKAVRQAAHERRVLGWVRCERRRLAR